MFQTTKQDKIQKRGLNKVKVSYLLDTEFKVIVIKMLIKLYRTVG